MPASDRTFRSAQRPFAARAERAAVLHAQGLARSHGRSAESASVSCADMWNHPLVRFDQSTGSCLAPCAAEAQEPSDQARHKDGAARARDRCRNDDPDGRCRHGVNLSGYGPTGLWPETRVYTDLLPIDDRGPGITDLNTLAAPHR